MIIRVALVIICCSAALTEAFHAQGSFGPFLRIDSHSWNELAQKCPNPYPITTITNCIGRSKHSTILMMTQNEDEEVVKEDLDASPIPTKLEAFVDAILGKSVFLTHLLKAFFNVSKL